MLPYLSEEEIEHYYICLMEARVKTAMTEVELECPGTYERYHKLHYFERKIELYTKLIFITTMENTQLTHSCWVRLLEAIEENEEQFERYKPFWTFK